MVKTELDNENGTLVYSVELSSGAEVKVDAGTGSIVFTDSGADSSASGKTATRGSSQVI